MKAKELFYTIEEFTGHLMCVVKSTKHGPHPFLQEAHKKISKDTSYNTSRRFDKINQLREKLSPYFPNELTLLPHYSYILCHKQFLHTADYASQARIWLDVIITSAPAAILMEIPTNPDFCQLIGTVSTLPNDDPFVWELITPDTLDELTQAPHKQANLIIQLFDRNIKLTYDRHKNPTNTNFCDDPFSYITTHQACLLTQMLANSQLLKPQTDDLINTIIGFTKSELVSAHQQIFALKSLEQILSAETTKKTNHDINLQ